MKTTVPLLVAGFLAIGAGVGISLVIASANVARAQAPSAPSALAKPAAPPPAAPTASASASSSASAKAAAEAPVTLASRTLPTDRSDPPKRDAWGAAVPVELSRTSSMGRLCKAHLLREYIKVECPFAMGGVRQFAGSPKDVELFVTPKTDSGSWFSDPLGGYVVFPLRKGEGRLFQFFTLESGYESVDLGDSVLIDASWAESQPSPTVVVR